MSLSFRSFLRLHKFYSSLLVEGKRLPVMRMHYYVTYFVGQDKSRHWLTEICLFPDIAIDMQN